MNIGRNSSSGKGGGVSLVTPIAMHEKGHNDVKLSREEME